MNNILHLYGTSLQRVLHSGRTKPCIFFCEDESGEKSGEYVVKLKAGMETGVKDLVAKKKHETDNVKIVEGKK